jgi:hypothetical protein
VAIDERLIRLQDVPAVVLELRPGSKHLHWATCYRWARKGCRGIKLWSIPVGGRQRLTSRTAVREFLDQLAERHGQPDAAPETERQLTRACQGRGAKLAADGW